VRQAKYKPQDTHVHRDLLRRTGWTCVTLSKVSGVGAAFFNRVAGNWEEAPFHVKLSVSDHRSLLEVVMRVEQCMKSVNHW